jgi:hypothetical protein
MQFPVIEFQVTVRQPDYLCVKLWNWRKDLFHTTVFGASAGRCPPPRTPCIGSFGAGAGRGPRPRTPCIGSFCAGAGRHCVASPSRHPPPRRPLRAPAACRYHRQLALQAKRAHHRIPPQELRHAHPCSSVQLPETTNRPDVED